MERCAKGSSTALVMLGPAKNPPALQRISANQSSGDEFDCLTAMTPERLVHHFDVRYTVPD
jgi:hypothetical protein